MTLGKLFIMKQIIIIYKIYKQDLVVSNCVFFSTNELPMARETTASLLEKPLDKLLYCLLILSGQEYYSGHPLPNSAAFWIVTCSKHIQTLCSLFYLGI